MSSIFVLPVEVLEHIFEFITDAHDALQVALTSRRLYALALPAVYGHIDWMIGQAGHGPASRQGREYLLANPQLLRAVKSFRISEKSSKPESDYELPWNWRAAGEMPRLSKNLFLRHPRLRFIGTHRLQDTRIQDPEFEELSALASTFMSAIPSFRNLETLTLRSVSLPRDFFYIVHGLANSLRCVTVRSCRLTAPYPSDLDPSALRITELTLLQLQQGPRTSWRKLKGILKLARSPWLHTLRIDRSLEVALGSLAVAGVPRTLHTLVCDFRGVTPRGRKPLAALFKFLNACFSVRELALTDMDVRELALAEIDLFAVPIEVPQILNVDASQVMHLSRRALPDLACITAPIGFLSLFIRGRPLQSVAICDSANVHPPLVAGPKVADVEASLRSLSGSAVGLESIQFNIRDWDKEVMYMLSAILPNVKDLRIGFCSGEPDDDFFMTLGNLIEFPFLERLHLYRFGHCMADATDEDFEDQREYMIIWQRYMPHLVEVALASDVLWVKCSETKKWSRNAIKSMVGVKGLLTY